MLPLADALRIIDRVVTPLRQLPETLPVVHALGRVLAEDHYSSLDLPPFDKSAVDGYAIANGDPAAAFRVLGTVAAGQSWPEPLATQTAVRMMTGAPVPAGTQRVVMFEQAQESADYVRFTGAADATHICPRAEDVRAGTLVLPAGTRLGPLQVANLIACGLTEAVIVPQLRVALLSTGDELCDDLEQLSPGQIMNSNAPLLVALATRHGMRVTFAASVKDEPERLRQAIQQAMAAAQVVVLSGGVSAGDYDFVPQVLTELGCKLHFHMLAVKPGKPTLFATADERVIIGLPGNPLAVYLMFHLLVRRAAARLLGASDELREMRLPLAQHVHRRCAERLEFAPCRLTADGKAELVECHGSAHLGALLQADGFACLPFGQAELAADEAVTVLPLVLEGRDA